MDSGPHLSPAFDRIVTGSNNIGFKLLSELATERAERNVLISPLSVAFALCMLQNGAGGATRTVLQDVLATRDFAIEEINNACLKLRSSLISSNSENLIKLANGLWAHQSLRFLDDFAQTVKHFYAAEVRSLNFNDPSSLTLINEWARDQTGGKIYPLLTRDDFSAVTECVMSAAVYFKGAWAQPFPAGETHKASFYLPSGRTKDVLMMERIGGYQFRQSPEFQMVGLPYGQGRLSMYVVLPAENSTPAELLRQIDDQRWEKWLTGMKEKQLALFLPRFKVDYEAELDKPLSKIGLSNIFSSEADFSLLGLGNQQVEKFKHKTKVEVNEEGAEVAAVSAVMLGRGLPANVQINRPFFWAIRDNRSRALIFTGLMLDPTEN
jgi:serpin B